jgi:hypothetical protein
LTLVAILAVVTASGHAGTIRHDVMDEVYLNFGLSFGNVGQVAFSTDSGNYLGSGTLIAPQWVLTAGHVVEDATQWTFYLGGNAYSARPGNLVAHPGWDGDLLSGYDIGLAKLDAPVDVQAMGISPADLYTGSSELGNVGTSVGFGRTGTGLTGAVTYDGRKRAGQNVIDEFYEPLPPGETPRILLSDFDSGSWFDNVLSGQRQPLNLEYLIAPGDSGGPVFIPGGDGWVLAGVHSFVMGLDGYANSDYGDISGHTRVSAFDDWIGYVTMPIPGDANLDGLVDTQDFAILKYYCGRTDAGWTEADFNDDHMVDTQDFTILKAYMGETGSSLVSVPEPATLLLLGAAVPVLLKSRRRS